MLRPHRNRSAGFSFIEVLTAMALVAILYTIAAPRFSQLRGPYAARAAASQVASAFQLARMRAIATNSTVRITYDATNRTYTIDRLVGGSWVTDVRNQLPTGVGLTSATVNPQFSRTGLLSSNVTVNVNAYGSGRTVNINVLGNTTIS